ncbi:hypothetical protein GCM10023172_04020 [Hymenobacter ginsengisoli]|uniref:DUF4178 domain-containing protein n=1 Tax=Hymenobacter ginsengisoli TaxID=1051626 RepID=A0ABP8PYW3_9BACT|nr:MULTISPECIES: hypothetical protein [unclassified Hymenobacter]MBO2030503.1 hypothetical protein [Hymenobacter sp. BT559]
MSELAPSPATVVWVTCPQCAAPLPCQDPAHSRYFGCARCRTFFRANPLAPASGAQRLDGFKTALEPGPSLPLGQVALLGGYRCRLTGYQVRGEQNDRLAEWREYQLRPAEPLTGDDPADFPLQLAEYQGHWLLVRRAWQAPDVVGPRSAQDGSWEDETGRSYQLWHRYQPLIRDALGEFDWNILDDEDLRLTEYISPPYLLASEQLRSDRPSWYLAQYLEPEQVAQAFGLARPSLPVRRGVGAAQPNPTQHWPQLARLAGLVAGLLTVLQILFFLLKPTVNGAEEFVVTSPDRAGYQQMVVSKSFEMREPGALAVTLETPDLNNHWAEITASLVNEQTGRGYEFTRSLEYYEGVEDGEHWTEGSRSVDAIISAVPAGHYHFNFYPTLEKDTGAVALILRLEENTALWSNYLLIMSVLALLPLWVWLRRRSFEQDRWSNSDFNPYATEN